MLNVDVEDEDEVDDDLVLVELALAVVGTEVTRVVVGIAVESVVV